MKFVVIAEKMPKKSLGGNTFFAATCTCKVYLREFAVQQINVLTRVRHIASCVIGVDAVK